MSRTAMEWLPGSSAPVLSAALLARIHELNLDYLELLTAEHTSAGSAVQLQYLPQQLVTAIVSLVAPARRCLAGTPYTLYSLGFEDEGFWRAACQKDVQPVAQRYASANAAWLQGPFCEVALLHAWHVATSSPLAARVLYAMPETTANRLAATSLWRIKRIANDYPALLTPRWPTNPGFWPDLLRFAKSNDMQRLALAQLLGSQLIAAELEHATAHSGPGKRTPLRLLQSPRLRARKLRFEVRVR
ncbi:MAG: hypothetical protein ACREV5_14100 [Steroidobacter sp.]